MIYSRTWLITYMIFLFNTLASRLLELSFVAMKVLTYHTRFCTLSFFLLELAKVQLISNNLTPHFLGFLCSYISTLTHLEGWPRYNIHYTHKNIPQPDIYIGKHNFYTSNFVVGFYLSKNAYNIIVNRHFIINSFLFLCWVVNYLRLIYSPWQKPYTTKLHK